MQKYLFTALLFVLPFFVGAQDVKDLIKAGIQLHDAGDFKGAIAKYEEALRLDAKSPSALFEIANTYVALEEYKKALKYVEKAPSNSLARSTATSLTLEMARTSTPRKVCSISSRSDPIGHHSRA